MKYAKDKEPSTLSIYSMYSEVEEVLRQVLENKLSIIIDVEVMKKIEFIAGYYHYCIFPPHYKFVSLEKDYPLEKVLVYAKKRTSNVRGGLGPYKVSLKTLCGAQKQ